MKRPNILIFMTDQQRGDTIPPYSRAKTPNLDKLCAEGITFSKTYCPSPHCCPSRATFFSSLYPSQHGVWNNVSVGNALSRGFYKGIRLWSEDFKDSGYNMYFSGKWHCSHIEGPDKRGWQLGFNSETYYTEEDNNAMPKSRYWDGYKGLPPQKTERSEGDIIRSGYRLYTHYGVKENPFSDRAVVDDAINIIKSREKSDTPWCQFIGTLGPHDPYFVPQRFLDDIDINDIELPPTANDKMEDKPALYRRTRGQFDQLSDREKRESIRHYLAFCAYEDALFGEVIDALEQSGEADDTLILYISDHGDYMGEHGLWCKGLPCFESAYHVPAVIKWKNGVVNSGRVVEEFVSLADFGATFLESANISIERELVGKSLMPFIKDQQPPNWREELFTQSNGNELYGIQRAVTTKKWKYVYNGYDFDELYDLENDPNQTTNLATMEEYKETIRELSKKLWQFAKDTNDVCISQYIMVALAPFGPAVIYED